jgi:anion-transporting  ArsA/GET3 family ATPase
MSKSTKVTVFIGPGGVGKTTLSSAFALKESAINSQRKYKLITIDPSKRLRDVFSMEPQDREKKIKDNLLVSLNQRDVLFKDFLESSLIEGGLLEDFYKSRILRSLLDDLSIAQEFTTFYELFTSIKSEDFDHIIIDTPPLQNTADFMTSVEKLEGLFSSAFLSLFLAGDKNQNIFYRVIHASRQMSFRLLKNLTGEDFVNELEIFFKVTELLRLKILEVVKESKKILRENSEFYLVCNHTELSLRALNLSLWLLKKDKNLHLKKAFINKYDPKAYSIINEVLDTVRESIETQVIQKKDFDLNNLNNLAEILNDNDAN